MEPPARHEHAACFCDLHAQGRNVGFSTAGRASEKLLKVPGAVALLGTPMWTSTGSITRSSAWSHRHGDASPSAKQVLINIDVYKHLEQLLLSFDLIVDEIRNVQLVQMMRSIFEIKEFDQVSKRI